jgi:hypothetical protein
MGLADELLAPYSGPMKGQTCSIAVALEQLDASDGSALVAVLATRSMPAAELSRRLRVNGIQVSQGAIGRHRRGECKCPR